MLDSENTVVVIVDVQEKLTGVMAEKEKLVENIQKLLKGADVLGLPVIVTEQNPKGLGGTINEISVLMPGHQPVSKLSFSCYGERLFLEKLVGTGCQQVLLAGIEAHVCVCQTAVDLAEAGFDVQVLIDCISSRTIENKNTGIERMRYEDICLTGVETALFELVKVAEGEKFKQILRIVK